MQNVVINTSEMFHYDQLRNDKALGNGNSDKNKNNSRNINVGSAWRAVSGSKNRLGLY